MGSRESFVGASLADRAAALLEARSREALPARYLSQVVHLTCPAPVWRYVEGAVERSRASLVMLDLEDSIPRGDGEALGRGRDHVVRALETLDWGAKLRFFRPRGLALDPGFEDLFHVVTRAGDRLDGLIYPKVDGPEEVALLDEALSEAEERAGLDVGRIRLELLIESVHAEERLDDIASASSRLAGLIFGAFDYWSSLGLAPDLYRPDHPLVMDIRSRLVKAGARAGVTVIAEMTLNYPTRDKSEAERRAALDECRRDAELARDCGFAGKWVGIPSQAEVVFDVFRQPPELLESAIAQVRAFQDAEREGRGAVMIEGRMADRATDRLNRAVLYKAWVQGRLDEKIAVELGLLDREISG